MENISEAWHYFIDWIFTFWAFFINPLFKLGPSEISLATIVYFILAFIGLSLVSRRLKHILVHNVLSKTQLESGVQASIGTAVRFLILVIGSIIIAESAGIDLSVDLQQKTGLIVKHFLNN